MCHGSTAGDSNDEVNRLVWILYLCLVWLGLECVVVSKLKGQKVDISVKILKVVVYSESCFP